MPNGEPTLSDRIRQKRQPQNRSRIVVEGIDEPKREGRYSDRTKIDPFTRQWFYQHEVPQGQVRGSQIKRA